MSYGWSPPPLIVSPWWTNTRLQSVKPGFSGAFPLPPNAFTVPVRVMGEDRSDEEETLFGADGDVPFVAATPEFPIFRLRTDAYCRVEAVRAWFSNAGSTARADDLWVQLATGPRTGWAFAGPSTEALAGVYGRHGTSQRTAVDFGVSLAQPAGRSTVSVMGNDEALPPGVPIFLTPGQELLLWGNGAFGATTAARLRASFYWRELG